MRHDPASLAFGANGAETMHRSWIGLAAHENPQAEFETNSGAGELYDLADDPQEIDNRLDDAGMSVGLWT